MKFYKYAKINKLNLNFINKFNFRKTKTIPKIKKIILNFYCKTPEIRIISKSLLAIELLTNQKGKFLRSKSANMLLKIKKGSPTGCMITLNKNHVFTFISKITTNLIPKIKNFYNFTKQINISKKSFYFEINEYLIFNELEVNYNMFSSLPSLKVILLTNSNEKKMLILMIKSLKFPIKP